MVKVECVTGSLCVLFASDKEKVVDGIMDSRVASVISMVMITCILFRGARCLISSSVLGADVPMAI